MTYIPNNSPHSRYSRMFFSLLRGELLHSSYRQMSISSKVSTLKHCPLVWVGPSKINCSNCFRRTSPDMVVSVCNGVSFLIIIITSSKKKKKKIQKPAFQGVVWKEVDSTLTKCQALVVPYLQPTSAPSLGLSPGKFRRTQINATCVSACIYICTYIGVYIIFLI